jgi:hypothetical protein
VEGGDGRSGGGLETEVGGCSGSRPLGEGEECGGGGRGAGAGAVEVGGGS